MPISKKILGEACRSVAKSMVNDPDGWFDNISSVISNLNSPKMANSPIAAEKLALLNTLIAFTKALGGLKKRPEKKGGEIPGLPNTPHKIFLLAVNKSLEHIKGRIETQLINIDQILTTGNHYDKNVFIKGFREAASNMVGNSSESFLNKVLVPGVLLAGEKRLNEIGDGGMAEFYCYNLISQSGLFSIYDSTQPGMDSIEKILTTTYKTMTTRIQDIYYVLNQTVGLEETVYVKPEIKYIVRCIQKFEAQLCGGNAKMETIATRNYVSDRAKILYLYAWNLEVTNSDILIINLLNNPKTSLDVINTGIFENLLSHLDELVSPANELVAWNETIREMG